MAVTVKEITLWRREINLRFLVAQVMGSKFSAVYGFDNDSDRRRAVSLLRKTPKKR